MYKLEVDIGRIPPAPLWRRLVEEQNPALTIPQQQALRARNDILAAAALTGRRRQQQRQNQGATEATGQEDEP